MFLDRALEHQPREVLAQRFIDFFEHPCRRGQSVRQLLAHADSLTALTWKNKGARHGSLPYCYHPFRLQS